MITKIPHTLEPVLHLILEGVGQQSDQCLGGVGLNCFLRNGDDRTNVKAGRLDSGVGSTFSGSVQPHGSFVEVEVGDRTRFWTAAAGFHYFLESSH